MDHTNGSLPGIDAASIHPESGSIFTPTGGTGTPVSGFFAAPLSSAAASGSQPAAELPVGAESQSEDRKSHHAFAGRTVSRDRELGGFTAAQESIEFRILRSESPARRLRLTGNRYTFGSADGCSIRLSDPSLRPMHAVLIRDRGRVLVRAYSSPIEVNGERVAETTIEVGDQLKLGEYTFELLEINVAAPSPSEQVLSDTTGFNATGIAGQGVAEPNGSFPANTKTVETDDTVWRQRLRREIDQWRSRQVECDQRETRCDQREAHLRGRESELWSRAENLYRREAKLQDQESTVYQLHDEYAAKQEELLKLQDQANHKQRWFQQRESEFTRQEVEYQEKLEEATSQLLVSQSQAAAATEAVREMRKQFDALNEQIEALSAQQNDLKQHETTEREENQRLRGDLESQRDAAIDAQARSEALRTEAEARVNEMTEEIESLRDQNQQAAEQLENQQVQLQRATASQTDQTLLIENERTIASLRSKVDELQATVDEASEEATRLRVDYHEALDSVRQLEGLVAQSNERGDVDRSEWAAEADSLRSEIESLSSDLERTRNELDDLKAANESLTHRLQEVELERDEAIEEISDRPTREAFDHLRNELEDASRTLAELQQGIQSTNPKSMAEPVGLPVLVDAPRANPENAETGLAEIDEDEPNQHDLPMSIAAKLPATPSLTESSAVESLAVEPSADSVLDDAGATASDEDGDDYGEDVWPMYQTQVEPEQESPVSKSDETPSIWDLDNLKIESNPNRNQPSAAEDPASNPVTANSAWNAESSQIDALTPDADAAEDDEPDSIDVTGIWNREQSQEALSDANEEPSALGFMSPEPKRVDDVAGVSVDDAGLNGLPEIEDSSELLSGQDSTGHDLPESNSHPQGSLANLLISDLENDVQPDNVSTDSVWDCDEDDEVSPFAQANSEHENESGVGADHESDASSEHDYGLGFGEMTAMMPEPHPSNESVPTDADADAAMDMDSKESNVANAFASYHQEMEDELQAEQVDASEIATVGDAEPENAVAERMASGEADSAQQPAASDPIKTADNTQDSDSDDDSIEAYMNRLLGRVQATPGSQESAKTSSDSSASVSVSLSVDPVPATTESSIPMVPEVETDPDAPLVPRSKAPERNSNLSAMRDLANQSARSAISRSTRIQTRNMQIAGLLNFGVAGIAVLFGLGASFLLSGGLYYLAWVMVLIIAGISIRDGMRNLSDARSRLQSARKGDEDAEDQEAEPNDAWEDNAKAEARLNAEHARAHAGGLHRETDSSESR